MAKHTTAAMLAVLVALTVAPRGSGQEPEQLPPPKQQLVEPPPFYLPYAPPPVVPSVPPPMNSREGWMYFAPNYMGQMRPRVIMAHYGSYYLYNGWPYYGISSGRGYLLPRTTD